ncbi:unnamed protein product, partial [marine sediment metagenome]
MEYKSEMSIKTSNLAVLLNKDMKLKKYSILDAIGNTPLAEL